MQHLSYVSHVKYFNMYNKTARVHMLNINMRTVLPGDVSVGFEVSVPEEGWTNLLSGLHLVTGTNKALLPLQVKYRWP